MKSLTTPEFWQMYAALPPEVRAAARKVYKLWQQNPRHGSLQFQKRGRFWRVSVGLGYRALALPVAEHDYDHNDVSPQDSRYNCIAWAAGEQRRRWWPPQLPQEEVTKENFIRAFELLGYRRCK